MKKKWFKNLMMDLKYGWKEEGVHIAKAFGVACLVSLLASVGLPPVDIDPNELW